MNDFKQRRQKMVLKRLTSIFMVLLFTFSFVFENQYNAFADSGMTRNDSQIDAELDIAGNNSFGKLVADGLLSKNAEQLENNGYNVFSVDIENSVATVSFETNRDCSLIVGIYDNEGESMLAFGTAKVIAEETVAYVDIDTDNMPDYFYIRAYLVDSDTLRPLCSEYSSPMYTRNMQEFLSKTTNDFDPNRVMNLDDKEDTNFAVFNETTKLIPTVENVNEIVSANEETQEYVFTNTDENITSLSVGDIFAYDYNDEVIIVKVGSINIDGTNVTITGQNTELDEVFEHLRIDGEAPTETAKTDVSELEDGITYLGCSEDAGEISTYGIDLGGGASWSHKFTFGETGDEYKDDTFSGKYKFTGSLDLKLDASAKVYISWGETYFEIKLNVSAKFVADFNGTASRKSIPLAFFEISPITGVFVRIKPAFIIEGKGECKSDITFSWTTGFKASTSSGKQNLTSKPKISLNSEATVTIFIGFSLEPQLVILHEKIASASLKGKAGVEIKATLVKMSTDSKGVQHDCESCIDGDVDAKINLTATVKLLNKDSMKFDFKMVDVTAHLMDFYYSFDYNEWGLKECPHISYPVSVRVVSTKSAPISNAKIVAEDQSRTATTDGNGKATIMLSPGLRKITVTADGYNDKKAIVTVSKFTKSAKVKLYAIGENTPIEEFRHLLDEAIKKGASNPDDVDYNLDVEEIPEELIELKVKQVSLGSGHSAAIAENGSLYMWGDNYYGQLGMGQKSNRKTNPIKVMDNVTYVSLGGNHSACITDDGSLYTWGHNCYGQLGDGTWTDKITPTKIMDNVISVSLRNSYSICITEKGELYAWGYNMCGNLGDGTTIDKCIPTKIMDNVAQLIDGLNSACITKDRSLYTWGYSTFFYPSPAEKDKHNIPVKIMDNVSTASLEEIINGACITNDNSLYLWGDAYFVNDIVTSTKRYPPTKIMDNVVSTSVGCGVTAFITKEGDLYTLGYNSMGWLGNGASTYYKQTPTKIMNNVVSVNLKGIDSYPGNCSCITEDGSLYIWGDGIWENEINGKTEDHYTPRKVMDNVALVTAEDYYQHSACITNDGSLYMWGLNNYGQLGNGTVEDSSIPIKVEFPKIPVSDHNAYSANSIRAVDYSAENSNRTFSDLIPNETYNYYSVNSFAASDMLSADNLLYVGQAVTDENGTLTIPDYVPNGEIFVKAMTEFDVYNAEITSAETENKNVSLTWNPINGASEYEVISYSENGIATYPRTSDTHITINDLAGGDYGFVVTSIIYGEHSVPAMNDIVLVHVDEPTKVPTLTVEDADGKAKLSWEDIDNALAYKVYSYENGEYKLLTFTAENSYTVQDLTIGEKYGFIVSACVKDVWSELSESNVVYITIGSHTHNYSTEWKYDNSNHWHECACGNKTDIAEHTFDSNGQCTVCSANMEKQTVVVTFPDSVMVTTSLEAIVHSGDEVSIGDKLHIDVTIPDGKKLTSLTVNGVAIENGATYTVGTEDVVIAVTFEDNTEPPAEKIKITIPENVAVTRDGVLINNGDEIHSGDVLRIEATVPVGKKLTSLTVNGMTIENGSTYTVGGEDVIIAVVFEDIETPPTDKYNITIPSGITVTRQNITLNNGDEISEGDVLNINVDIPSGYKLNSLTVNGRPISNGDTYTVGKENVVIDVSFEKLTGDNPSTPDTPNKPDDDSKPDNTKQPFIISNSDIIGWSNILDELTISSDKTIMVDMNGTTLLPANILQAIKDNSIKLMLKMNEQVSWSIDGKDVERIDRDIDLQVIIGDDNIPEESIKKFVGEREYLTLSIKHSGDLGFSAFLVIDVGEQYGNEPAALYWFKNNAFKLEDSCKVQYGKTVLKFTHASDWIIAFGEAEPATDNDNSNSDSSSDDTSRPIDARPNEPNPDESNNSKPTTTEPSDSSDDEKDNPHTGSSRVSLATFLALITSAALCLITRKQKR